MMIDITELSDMLNIDIINIIGEYIFGCIDVTLQHPAQEDIRNIEIPNYTIHTNCSWVTRDCIVCDISCKHRCNLSSKAYRYYNGKIYDPMCYGHAIICIPSSKCPMCYMSMCVDQRYFSYSKCPKCKKNYCKKCVHKRVYCSGNYGTASLYDNTEPLCDVCWESDIRRT